jgi:prepilin-type N-terminal cleavage/methylation domain-containing protein
MPVAPSPSSSHARPRRDRGHSGGAHDRGFTLIEILIAIVLVGILAAVAVVAIGRLVDRGSAASCEQSADAALVAATSYFANNQRYPTSFDELTAPVGDAEPPLVLGEGVTANGSALSGSSWTLTMAPGSPPTFTCATNAGEGGGSTPVVASTTTVGGSATTTTAPSAATTTTTAATTTTVVATTTTPPPAAPTTTAPPATNGVTAVASTTGDLRYFGEQIVRLTNTAPVDAMTVTVRIAVTPGLSNFRQYKTFWTGTVADSSTVVDGVAVYTFTLNPGYQIVPGSWTMGSQWTGVGQLHPTTGDTWTVVTTSQGVTSTLTGRF